MNTKQLLSTVTAVLFGSMSSFAAVDYYVSPNGDDGNDGSENAPFETVEQAIMNVFDNTETTIHLESYATFKIGKLDLQENKIVTIIGDNTVLLGADKPGEEGGEANRILRIGKNCKVSISGVTFENGRQIEYLGGGAIYFEGEELNIDHCKFVKNESGCGGNAIFSRGNIIRINNSYFDENYAIGGAAEGGAITHAGKKDGTGGELYVYNSTFYKNKLKNGGQGTAIATYDASLPNENGGKYTGLKKLEVVNCTFVGNTSTNAYQAPIDISHGPDCETYLINNTFNNNDGALRLEFQVAPVYMFNNVALANKSCVLSEMSIADSDRTAIVAYNNVLSGKEKGVNEGIDDPCFNDEKENCNNIVDIQTNYPIGKIGIANALKSDDNFVPYLPIATESSILINAGLDDSKEYTKDNLIPQTDVRGFAKKDQRDIGAYEFEGSAGVTSTTVSNESAFKVFNTASTLVVLNSSNLPMTVLAYTIDGKQVFSKTTNGSTSIDKAAMPQGIVVLSITNNNESLNYKCIIK